MLTQTNITTKEQKNGDKLKKAWLLTVMKPKIWNK